MAEGFRASLKERIPESIWPLMRWFDKHLINSLYVFFWGKRFFLYPRIPARSGEYLKSILSFPITVELDAAHPEKIAVQLKVHDYQVLEGRHSVYLWNKNDIERFCPDLQTLYPDGIGLKIVRSREISRDGTPYYTSRKVAPASTWFSMRAVGSMLEKMVISNLLHMDGVAPRVYDIVRLTNSCGGFYAFVVQHIQGDVLTGPPADVFMTKFKKALLDNGMEIISIREHRDLRGPEYNRNIVFGSSGTRYVDIQNFVICQQLSNILNQNCLTPFQDHARVLDNLIREKVSFSEQKILCAGKIPLAFWANHIHRDVSWCTAIIEDDLAKPLEQQLYLRGLTRFAVLQARSDGETSVGIPQFSQYDILCLDDSYLSFLTSDFIQCAGVEFILVVSRIEGSCQGCIRLGSVVKEKYQTEHLCSQGEITVTVFKRLTN